MPLWKGVYCVNSFILCRFAVMLREKEDTELKPVSTEDDITYIYVKVGFVVEVFRIEWKSVSSCPDKAERECDDGDGVPEPFGEGV